jgi:hypothetical protein
MKPCIALTLVLALTLAAVPALAGEDPAAPTAVGDTFQAFRNLPAGQQAQLIALDEAQLAAIEGSQVAVGVCGVCLNLGIAANVLSTASEATTGAQSINVGTNR